MIFTLSLRSFHILFFLVVAALSVYGQDNNVCRSADLDWYTNRVGETPCRTYERLRQICDTSFTTPKMLTKQMPGDYCDNKIPECCCNSIAWSLSMLCTNCQRTLNSDNGLDALPRTFDEYLEKTDKCSPSLRKLPTDIQQSACKAGLKIPIGVYNVHWNDGAWYYRFYRETIEKDFGADPQAFYKCDAPEQIISKAVDPGTPIPLGVPFTMSSTDGLEHIVTSVEVDRPVISTSASVFTTTNSQGNTVTQTSVLTQTILGQTQSANATASATQGTSTNLNEPNTHASEQEEQPSTRLGVGPLAGIAFGSVAALGILLFIFLLVLRKHRNVPLEEKPNIHIQPFGLSRTVDPQESKTSSRSPSATGSPQSQFSSPVYRKPAYEPGMHIQQELRDIDGGPVRLPPSYEDAALASAGPATTSFSGFSPQRPNF